jgi:hypothetical protein
MDPESKKLIEETFELAKENNKMLHRVRRVQKRQALWSFIKVVFVIGISVGALYFLQPFMDKAIGLFNQISGTSQSLQDNSVNLKDVLKKL